METGTLECKLHYCTLTSVLPVGIFHTDVEGHYLWVNECWCEIAGITAAEVEENSWVQLLYPDDQERVFGEWHRAVQENLPFRSEYRFRRSDGKVTWVLGQAVAEKDETGAAIGYVGTITDITQYKQTQEEFSQYRHHLEELLEERSSELRQANEQLQQEIQERKRVEETQARVAAILEATTDFVATADLNGHAHYINKATRKLVGLEEQGEILLDIAAIHPSGEQERIFHEMFPTALREGVWRGETVLLHRDGREIPVSLVVMAHKSEGGTVEFFSTIMRDISEYKRIEAELLQVNERFQLAAEAVNFTIYDWDIAKKSVYRTEGLINLLGYRPQEAEPTNEWWLDRIHPDDRQRMQLLVSAALAHEKIFAFEYRICNKDNQYLHVWDHGLIIRDGDGRAVRVVGSMIDITQRKQAEERLRSTQEFLAKLLDYTPAPIYIVTADEQRYRLVNRAWEELVGIRREEAIGYSIDELFPPAVTQQFKQVNQQVIDTGAPVIAEEFVDVADGRHYFHTVKFPIKDALGQIEAVGGISLDITERKQAEEALRLSEERFRMAVDNIPDTFVIYDGDRRFQFVNTYGIKRSGFSEDVLLGHTDEEIFPPEVTECYLPFLLRAVETRTPQTAECTIALGGDTYTIVVTYVPLLDEQGNIDQILGITHDISDAYRQATQRKRAEDALRQSEERFRQMAENIHEVFWMADPEITQMLYVSPAYEEIWGRTCASLYAQPRSFIEAIHPDDRERVLAAFEQHRQSGFSHEYRIIQPDGSVRWIWERGFPVRNQAGQLESCVGISQDISDRKIAEEALCESRERLQLFIDHAPASVAMFDRQMRYIAVSRRWLTTYNLENQAIIGKSHYDIFPDIPEHWKDVHQRCLKGAVERCDSDSEALLRSADRFERANGDEIWLRWEVRPWYERNGEIGGIVIFNENITDRKIAEEALRQSEERFRLIAENSTDMISRHTPEEGIYLYASPACQTLLGYAPEELVGHSAYEFFHPDDLAQIRKAHTTILDLPETYTVAYRHRCKDGHYIWLETTCHTIRDQQTGAVLEIQSASRDITERKQAEAALRQQLLREQLIARMTQRIHKSLNLEEILNTTVAEVRQFLECDRVIIYRLESHQSGVVVVESVGSGWKSISGTIINDCYFADNYFQLYQQGRIQALEDIYTANLTPCHVDLLARFQVKANLVVPIVQEEELWGLLVAQQCSRTRQWQPSEIDLLKSLATQSAIAIQKSELYAHSQAEIAQRQQAEAALQQQVLKERLIAQSAQRIRQSLNLEDILNTTVAEVRQFLACDRAIIFRFEPDWSGVVAVESVDEEWTPILGAKIYDHCFEVDFVQPYQEGRIQVLEDIYAAGLSPCHLDLLTQFQVRAKLVVPILQGEQLWGLLVAYHCSGPRQWQQFEIDLLKLLSTQVAIAIQQSQLYQQTQHQVHREQALNRVIQTIRNSLDLTTIFSTAVCEIAQLLETDRADIMQYLPQRKVWRLVAEYSQIPDSSNTRHEEVPDEGNERAARLKRLEIVRIDKRHTCVDDEANRDITQTFPGAWLLVPLHFNGSIWGSLRLVRKQEPSFWQDSEVELTCAVANQLAIALQQAELYEQSRTATAKAQTQAQQLEQALSELQKTQAQLVHSEKMSSLGQLVAGVAHEINNPVTFISGNVIFVEEYIQDLLDLIQLYQEQYPNSTLEIGSKAEKIDLDFLIDDLPRLLTSMKVGAERICEIVSALRNFSRHAEAEIKPVDIHEGLDSTLMILQHRLKAQGKTPGIKVIKEYGNLPKVECYAGQLNQVFMNLLSNAIDALEELRISRQSSVDTGNLTEILNVSTVAGEAQAADAHLLQMTTDENPTIWMGTEVLNDQQVLIRIADNGVGMTEQVKARLFDPFFTTKPVGAGTGLGLSISYQIVVKKHGGQLHCLSQLGQGTEFVIQIPIKQCKVGVLD